MSGIFLFPWVCVAYALKFIFMLELGGLSFFGIAGLVWIVSHVDILKMRHPCLLGFVLVRGVSDLKSHHFVERLLTQTVLVRHRSAHQQGADHENFRHLRES